MKQTIAICDLNAAVAAKDNSSRRSHTEICLFAQFAKRVTGKEVDGSTCTAALLDGEENYNFRVQDSRVRELVLLFDTAFSGSMKNIAEIRRLLPFEVEYKYETEGAIAS